MSPPPIDSRNVANGANQYFISGDGLANDETERCRQILEKLYVLGDWAAGEIVERRRRDEERERSGYHLLKPRLTVPEMLILRFLRREPGSTVGAISLATDMTSKEVGDHTDHLLKRGILTRSADGGKLSLSEAELERYRAALVELSGTA